MEKKDGKDKDSRRKLKNNPVVYRYSVNLDEVDNARFKKMFIESGVKNLSRFIAAMIFSRQMKVVKIDKAAMDYYMRLTNIYTQYQAVGVNYNQTVKAIKTNFGEKRAAFLLNKLVKETIMLVGYSQEILRLSKEFEEKYLNI